MSAGNLECFSGALKRGLIRSRVFGAWMIFGGREKREEGQSQRHGKHLHVRTK